MLGGYLCNTAHGGRNRAVFFLGKIDGLFNRFAGKVFSAEPKFHVNGAIGPGGLGIMFSGGDNLQHADRLAFF